MWNSDEKTKAPEDRMAVMVVDVVGGDRDQDDERANLPASVFAECKAHDGRQNKIRAAQRQASKFPGCSPPRPSRIVRGQQFFPMIGSRDCGIFQSLEVTQDSNATGEFA